VIATDGEQDIDDLFEKRFKTKRYVNSEKCEKKIDGIGELLKKQSKQIRALYELQKSTNEKTTWIQNQLKQQTNNMWPSFDDYKSELENGLIQTILII
jgi:hypothetical protein